MLSINIYVKFGLMALGLIGGLVFTLMSGFGFWYAIWFWLLFVIMLVSYIMMGTIQSASTLMQENKFDEAEKRLDMTPNPNWLYKTYRALFYLLKGSMAMQRKDTDTAEMWLNKAQAIELPSDDEKAMVALQLASINANRGKWKVAEQHYRILKSLNVRTPQIKEQIAQFDKMMKNKGAIKQASRMNRGGTPIKPGGKRRRPKIR
jgi:tetratricopeptide (TPR) repeat protein